MAKNKELSVVGGQFDKESDHGFNKSLIKYWFICLRAISNVDSLGAL